MQLDQRDLEILRGLSREGRITKAALADRIGLSPTPCWDRLKKLEKAGLIEGYRAEINLKKLASHVTVFVAAQIADHTAASFRSFEAAVQTHDEVAYRLIAVFHLCRNQAGQKRRRAAFCRAIFARINAVLQSY